MTRATRASRTAAHRIAPHLPLSPHRTTPRHARKLLLPTRGLPPNPISSSIAVALPIHSARARARAMPASSAAAAAAPQQPPHADTPLEQPPPLSKMLDEDRRQADDCTPCRIMGASAFVGLGVYSYVSGHAQLRQQRAAILASKSVVGMGARRASITGLAGVLVGMGVYRLVN